MDTRAQNQAPDPRTRRSNLPADPTPAQAEALARLRRSAEEILSLPIAATAEDAEAAYRGIVRRMDRAARSGRVSTNYAQDHKRRALKARDAYRLLEAEPR